MPKASKPRKRRAQDKRTPELEMEILNRLATGESLRQICRDDHMPVPSAVIQWTQKDPEFAEQYTRAREQGYLDMADELLEICDDGTNDWMKREGKDGEEYWQLNGEHLQRSKLRVDTRKWVLSKMLPKVYGDKQINEVHGPDGGPIQIEDKSSLDIARRIGYLLSQGAAKKDGNEPAG